MFYFTLLDHNLQKKVKDIEEDVTLATETLISLGVCLLS